MIPNVTSLNHLSRQIEKSLILFTAYILLSFGSNGQDVSNTGYATVSATIVTAMAGVEKLSDINFPIIKKGSENVMTGNSGLHIIGCENAYSVSLSPATTTVKNIVSDETMEVSLLNIMPAASGSNKGLTINADFKRTDKQSAGTYASVSPVTVIVHFN